ncbi:DUF192 domain-containing protein [Synechococcus moorigangaii CMS01]|nr:DUF192 domain-containing protein [Synechococcus moorigangaii CMS01]
MAPISRLVLMVCGTALVGCTPYSSEPADLGQTPAPAPAVTQTADTSFQGQILPITATAQVVGTDKVFDLEVAKTPEQQRLGLMYREFLPDDRGMLFEFQPPRPVSFWMKNCLINLDMIFLRGGIVQAIAQDVPPCEGDPCPTYGPPTDVAIDQVLEIRGGLAAEIGLEVGDRLEISPQAANP